jgi:putative transposase
LNEVYEALGITRQAAYQQRRRTQERVAQEEAICAWVRQKRANHPRMGTRKLWREMEAWLDERGIRYGRDRLFDLLRREGLLVEKSRRSRRTTFAGLWRCPNLMVGLEVTRPNQVWVSDITYIDTEQGFGYLALVTDVYSRRIMGYDFCPTLAVEGALRALRMACRNAQGSLVGLIHHSDHGVQYTCHAYRHLLAQHKMRSSMGEVGNCYDNALAERVNGILKLEYALECLFVSFAQAAQAVKQAVWLYNHERPHLSLAYRKPHAVYVNYFAKQQVH